MSKYGLLVTYKHCNGCHACETACQQAHGYVPEQYGLTITALGPYFFESGKVQTDYVATPTAYCDHCTARLTEGKQPACAEACPMDCIAVGELQQLGKQIMEKKMVLFTIQ